tara:strand:- start:2673 stop:2876 length:204 start_codon:yes stop_codon:yes gene_type:complete
MYSSKPKSLKKRKPRETTAKKPNKMTEKLKEHSKTHSPKHMAKMRKIIKEGKSFAQAHAMASKMVGK